MSEYNNKRYGPSKPDWLYRGWSGEKMHKLLLELQPIAKRWTLFGVAARINVKAYNEIVPIEGRTWLQHPYFLCMLCFYGAVLEEIRARFKEPKSKLNFVFDVSTQFNKYGANMFSEVQKDSDNERWMEAITFTNSREHMELQAADLLAFRARQVELRNSEKGRVVIRSNRLDKDLGLGKHVVFALDDDVSMRHKVRQVQERALKWEFPP